MATIVRGAIPARELALSHTLESLPDVEIECERIVQAGDDVILPLLWIRHLDQEAVEAALEEDPTVEDVNCLSTLDGEYLYRMEWIDDVHLLLHMLTNGHATVLDAYGRRDCWQTRVLFKDREHFSKTHEFTEEHGLTFDVESIRELDGEPAGRFGLTNSQYKALVQAARRGYFDIPREVSLEELADELDVSHQSLSELLRRGTGALVEDALLVGTFPEDECESA